MYAHSGYMRPLWFNATHVKGDVLVHDHVPNDLLPGGPVLFKLLTLHHLVPLGPESES